MRLHPILALAPLAAASPFERTSACLRLHADQITNIVSCADASLVAGCLASQRDGFPASALESCIVASGCAEDDAAFGAGVLADLCDVSGSSDLRKRADDAAAPPSQRTAAPSPAVTPVVTKRQDNNDDKATTEKDPRPSDTECYQTSTIATTTCKMGEGGSKCDPVNLEKVRCRDGWLCSVSRQGGTSCMERIDDLDTGGIIVAIIFGAAIVIALGLMTFFCCKDKREQKQLAAKAEAAEIAKASNVGSKARKVSDRQPLMAQGPPGAGSPGPSSPGAGYAGEQPNPFNDRSY